MHLVIASCKWYIYNIVKWEDILMDNKAGDNKNNIGDTAIPQSLQGSPYYHEYSKAVSEHNKISPYIIYYDSAYNRMSTNSGQTSSVVDFPKKKKRKILLTIFIIILSIALLAAGTYLIIFRDVIFNKPQESHLGEYYGLFAYAPVMEGNLNYIDYSAKFTEFAPQIEAGIQENASPEEKALAAYIIYRIGCLANATLPYKARYGTGSGSATGVVYMDGSEITVAGGMNVAATSNEIRYPLSKPSSVEEVYGPSYQLYVAGEEYTQIPMEGVTSSVSSILVLAEPILRITLPFARRYISTPEQKIVWDARIGTCRISEDSSLADFPVRERNITIRPQADIKAEEIAKGSARDYDESWGDIYGLTAHDMALHIINPSTILGDTVVIKKEVGTDINLRLIDFYSVEFEIDTVSNRGTTESATYYAEQFYKAQAPDVFINYLEDYFLYYSDLKVKYEVFNNGYFRTWSTTETWTMGGKVGDALVELISKNDSMEAYCYDYDTVMQGFVNRYYGDQTHVNKPMSALPFYDMLKGYTPEEYGVYR